MPTFLPRIPATFAISLSHPSVARGYWLGVIALRERPTTSDQRLLMFFSESLDLDIHASRQIELHQRIDRLLRRLENIEQTLVGADLKLLTRLLVDVWRSQDTVLVLHRGQW